MPTSRETSARRAIEVSTWTGAELEAVVAEAKHHARPLAKTEPERANQILLRGAALHADIARLIPEDTVRRSPNAKNRLCRPRRPLAGHSIHHHALAAGTLASRRRDAGSCGEPRCARVVRGDVVGLASDAPNRCSGRALRARAAALSFGPGHPLCERRAARALWLGSDAGRGRVDRRIEPHVCGGELGSRRAREGRAVLPRFAGASARACGGAHAAWARARRPRAARRSVGQSCAAPLRMAPAVRCCISPSCFSGARRRRVDVTNAARTAFERASALYPNAQSPRLALSQIARRMGDRRAAQRELQIIARLPDDERRREDPWWFYYDAR